MARHPKSTRYWTVLMFLAVGLAAISFGSGRAIFGGIYLACAVTCGWLAAQARRAEGQESNESPPDEQT